MLVNPVFVGDSKPGSMAPLLVLSYSRLSVYSIGPAQHSTAQHSTA